MTFSALGYSAVLPENKPDFEILIAYADGRQSERY